MHDAKVDLLCFLHFQKADRIRCYVMTLAFLAAPGLEQNGPSMKCYKAQFFM